MRMHKFAPHKPWTPADDEFVLRRLEQMTDAQLAEALDRSPEAVRARRHKLRRLGVANVTRAKDYTVKRCAAVIQYLPTPEEIAREAAAIRATWGSGVWDESSE